MGGKNGVTRDVTRRAAGFRSQIKGSLCFIPFYARPADMTLLKGPLCIWTPTVTSSLKEVHSINENDALRSRCHWLPGV